MDFLALLYVLYTSYLREQQLTKRLQTFTEFLEKLSQELITVEESQVTDRYKGDIECTNQ